MKKIFYVVLGFVAGVGYIVACSSGQLAGVGASLAAAIGNAVDVVFDNTKSGLTSTNVQDALDEITAQHGDRLAALLVGTWAGNEYGMTGYGSRKTPMTLTFNADGTFSCTIENPIDGEKISQKLLYQLGEPVSGYWTCKEEGSASHWEVVGRTIHLSLLAAADSAPTIHDRYYMLPVVLATNTELDFFSGTLSGDSFHFYGVKQ